MCKCSIKGCNNEAVVTRYYDYKKRPISFCKEHLVFIKEFMENCL